jgi:protein-disulfide isomerase
LQTLDGDEEMSKFIQTISAAVILMMIAGQPLWAASTKDELAELKEGQAAMQKDLADIKKLLEQGARAAPSKPAFKPTEVTIDDAPVLGAADATVTLVEFSDYQCPFCRRHKDQVMPDLVKNFVDTGKLKYVMREFPLAMHANAKGAAQAALCAGDQDQYWQMHDKMFENQRKLTVENLKAFGAELGLDSAVFDACLDDGKYAKQVSADLTTGGRMGITGTPAFVLGLTDPKDPNKANVTQFISGAQSLEKFTQTIEDLLKQAEEEEGP